VKEKEGAIRLIVRIHDQKQRKVDHSWLPRGGEKRKKKYVKKGLTLNMSATVEMIGRGLPVNDKEKKKKKEKDNEQDDEEKKS